MRFLTCFLPISISILLLPTKKPAVLGFAPSGRDVVKPQEDFLFTSLGRIFFGGSDFQSCFFGVLPFEPAVFFSLVFGECLVDVNDVLYIYIYLLSHIHIYVFTYNRIYIHIYIYICM